MRVSVTMYCCINVALHKLRHQNVMNIINFLRSSTSRRSLRMTPAMLKHCQALLVYCLAACIPQA